MLGPDAPVVADTDRAIGLAHKAGDFVAEFVEGVEVGAAEFDLNGVTDGWATFEGFGGDAGGGELIAGVFVEVGDELVHLCGILGGGEDAKEGIVGAGLLGSEGEIPAGAAVSDPGGDAFDIVFLLGEEPVLEAFDLAFGLGDVGAEGEFEIDNELAAFVRGEENVGDKFHAPTGHEGEGEGSEGKGPAETETEAEEFFVRPANFGDETADGGVFLKGFQEVIGEEGNDGEGEDPGAEEGEGDDGEEAKGEFRGRSLGHRNDAEGGDGGA